MNQGALSIQDVADVELLENMATAMNRVAEGQRDGDRYLAYRRASLALSLLAVDLRQGLAWRVMTQPERPAPVPVYKAGQRAFRAKEGVR